MLIITSPLRNRVHFILFLGLCIANPHCWELVPLFKAGLWFDCLVIVRVFEEL